MSSFEWMSGPRSYPSTDFQNEFCCRRTSSSAASNFSMTGVSHQAGQECDHPVERVILMVGRTGVHSSVLLFKTMPSKLRRCRVLSSSNSQSELCAQR